MVWYSYRLSYHTSEDVSTRMGVQPPPLAESGSYASIADVSPDSRDGNRTLDTACICACLGSDSSPLDQNIHQSQVEYELSGLSRDSDGVVDVVVDLGKMWRKVEESGRKWR